MTSLLRVGLGSVTDPLCPLPEYRGSVTDPELPEPRAAAAIVCCACSAAAERTGDLGTVLVSADDGRDLSKGVCACCCIILGDALRVVCLAVLPLGTMLLRSTTGCSRTLGVCMLSTLPLASAGRDGVFNTRPPSDWSDDDVRSNIWTSSTIAYWFAMA